MNTQVDAIEMAKRARQAVVAFGYVNKLDVQEGAVLGSSMPGFDLPEEDGTVYRLQGSSGMSQDGHTPITNFVLEVAKDGQDFEPMSQGIDIDVCIQRYERQLKVEQEMVAPRR